MKRNFKIGKKLISVMLVAIILMSCFINIPFSAFAVPTSEKKSGAETYTYEYVQTKSNFPVMNVTIEDKDLTDDKPGYIDKTAAKDDSKVNATFEMVDSDGTQLLSLGTSVNAEGKTVYPMTIKGRGNSSWTMPTGKKPYNIKFSSKQNLLGMGKHKSWSLIASWTDTSFIRNYLMYKMAKGMNTNVMDCELVELCINGEYEGLYLLIEKYGIDEYRIETAGDGFDVTGDGEVTQFLIESDSRAIENNEPNRFKIGENGDESWIVVKEPDEEDIIWNGTTSEDARYQYISEYMQKVNNAIVNLDNYEDYIDLDSFIDCYIINEFSNNPDFGYGPSDEQPVYSSTFMNVEEGGKVFFGTVWDLDISLGNVDYSQLSSEKYRQTANPEALLFDQGYWIENLYQDPKFQKRLHERWTQFREHIEYVTTTLFEETALLVAPSAEMDFAVWEDANDRLPTWLSNYIDSSKAIDEQMIRIPLEYDAEIDYVRSFLERSKAHLDSLWLVDTYPEEITTYWARGEVASGASDYSSITAIPAASAENELVGQTAPSSILSLYNQNKNDTALAGKRYVWDGGHAQEGQVEKSITETKTYGSQSDAFSSVPESVELATPITVSGSVTGNVYNWVKAGDKAAGFGGGVSSKTITHSGIYAYCVNKGTWWFNVDSSFTMGENNYLIFVIEVAENGAVSFYDGSLNLTGNTIITKTDTSYGNIVQNSASRYTISYDSTGKGNAGTAQFEGSGGISVELTLAHDASYPDTGLTIVSRPSDSIYKDIYRLIESTYIQLEGEKPTSWIVTDTSTGSQLDYDNDIITLNPDNGLVTAKGTGTVSIAACYTAGSTTVTSNAIEITSTTAVGEKYAPENREYAYINPYDYGPVTSYEKSNWATTDTDVTLMTGYFEVKKDSAGYSLMTTLYDSIMGGEGTYYFYVNGKPFFWASSDASTELGLSEFNSATKLAIEEQTTSLTSNYKSDAIGNYSYMNGYYTDTSSVMDGLKELLNIGGANRIDMVVSAKNGKTAFVRPVVYAVASASDEDVAVEEKSYAVSDYAVLDYGLPITVPVLSNDKFGDNQANNIAGIISSDYQKITNITIDPQFDTVNTVSGFAQANADDEGKDGSYGLVEITSSNEVKYIPTSIMNDIDVFYYAAQYTSGSDTYNASTSVTFVPASCVYYEDTFANVDYTSNDSMMGLLDAGKLVYSGDWPQSPVKGDTQSIEQTYDNSTAYGYDTVYDNDGEFSGNSAHYFGANYGLTYDGKPASLWDIFLNDQKNFASAYNSIKGTDQSAYLTFEFEGTGFDIISYCSADAGVIHASVYEAGNITDSSFNENGSVKDGVSTTAARDISVVSVSGDMNQVPVISMNNLAHGKYIVQLEVNGKVNMLSQGNLIYIDAIRVYNPLESGSSAVSTFYKSSEQESASYKIRDLIISGVYEDSEIPADAYAQGYEKNIGTNTASYISKAFYIDDISNSGADAPSILDYINFGSKNELYIAKDGDGISFVYNAQNAKTPSLLIDAKTFKGETARLKVTNVSNKSIEPIIIEVNSNTQMYYDITEILGGERTATIYIQKTSSDLDDASIISVSHIKIPESATLSTIPYLGVKSLNISGDTVMEQGTSQTLALTISPDDAIYTDSPVWSIISGEEFAVIDQNGRITASNIGTVEVQVELDGKTAVFKIQIEEKVVPVTSVTVTQADNITKINAASSGVPLTAAVLPNDATVSKDVTWSCNTSGVTVNNGVVTVSSAVSVGTKITITATSVSNSSVSGSYELEVTKVPVTSVSIDQAAGIALDMGQTTKLTASVFPANATYKTVSWSSNDTSIASVSSDGTVTAVAAGKARITATADGVSSVYEITVNSPTVTGVVIKENGSIATSGQVIAGQSKTLTAEVSYNVVASDSNVTWSTNNSNVTVSNGAVSTSSAITSETTVTITATSVADGTKKAEYTLTIIPRAVESITILKSGSAVTAISIYETETAVFTVNAVYNDGTTQTGVSSVWSTNNQSIATVQNGTVTGVAGGKTTVTATFGGVQKSVEVTVNPITVVSVTINGASSGSQDVYTDNGDITLTPSVTYNYGAADTAVNWSYTSDNSLNTFNATTGKITIGGAGTIVVTAASAKGSSKTATYTVNVTEKTVANFTEVIIRLSRGSDTIKLSGLTTTSAAFTQKAYNTDYNDYTYDMTATYERYNVIIGSSGQHSLDLWTMEALALSVDANGALTYTVVNMQQGKTQLPYSGTSTKYAVAFSGFDASGRPIYEITVGTSSTALTGTVQPVASGGAVRSLQYSSSIISPEIIGFYNRDDADKTMLTGETTACISADSVVSVFLDVIFDNYDESKILDSTIKWEVIASSGVDAVMITNTGNVIATGASAGGYITVRATNASGNSSDLTIKIIPQSTTNTAGAITALTAFLIETALY